MILVLWCCPAPCPAVCLAAFVAVLAGIQIRGRRHNTISTFRQRDNPWLQSLNSNIRDSHLDALCCAGKAGVHLCLRRCRTGRPCYSQVYVQPQLLIESHIRCEFTANKIQVTRTIHRAAPTRALRCTLGSQYVKKHLEVAHAIYASCHLETKHTVPKSLPRIPVG